MKAAMAAYWLSTGGQMVKLPVSTSTGRRRSSGTSIQPSRQPVIEKYLRERAEHHARARGLPGAATARHAVGDAVVDLVADQPYPVVLAPARDRGELVGRHHRAGGVGGRGEDEARRRARRPPRAARRSAGTGSPGPQSISTTSQPSAVSTLR